MSGREFQLAGTVIGAVAGVVLAIPSGGASLTLTAAMSAAMTGAAIGGLAGGLAGALYDTTTAQDSVNEQPTLADLTVQTSTLGVVIPQLWGQWGNLAGNIIWATDKQVHEHRTEQETGSGKGGGSAQVTINKTYSISYAIALCDTDLTGPIGGIKRMWRNATLTYDVNNPTNSQPVGAIDGHSLDEGGEGYAAGDMGDLMGTTGGTGARYTVLTVGGGGEVLTYSLSSGGQGYRAQDTATAVAASGGGNGFSITVDSITIDADQPNLPPGLTFYRGTTDQMPDPTIEADKGVGNVPAYRRLAYAVFKDDDLGPSGQVPNYTFELFQSTSGTSPLVAAAVSPTTGFVWVAPFGPKEIWVYDPDTVERTEKITLNTLPDDDTGSYVTIRDDGVPWATQGVAPVQVARLDPESYALAQSITIPPTTTTGSDVMCSNIVFTPDGHAWIATYQNNTALLTLHRMTDDGDVTAIPTSCTGGLARLAVTSDGHVWVTGVNNDRVERIDPASNSIVATVTGLGRPMDLAVADGDLLWIPDEGPNDGSDSRICCVDPATNSITAEVTVGNRPLRAILASDEAIWVACFGDVVVRIDPGDLSTRRVTFSGMLISTGFYQILAPGLDGAVWALSERQNLLAYVTPDGTLTPFRVGSQPLHIASDPTDQSVWVASGAGGSLQHFDDAGGVPHGAGALQSVNSVPVVIRTLCERAGIDADHLDLTDTPDGLVNMLLVSMQAVRAPLQQLAQAYRFYALESGRTLKFREIGAGDVVATIPEAALDAGQDTSEGKSALIERQDTISLPTSLYVSYVDPTQNYQNNAQQSQLATEVTTLEQPTSVSVTLALQPADARQLADELLSNMWINRTGLQTTLARPYAYLEPGDRIMVEARQNRYPLVLTETSYGAPGLVELRGVTDASFTRGAVGAVPGAPPPGQEHVDDPGTTTAALFNVQALHSSDQAQRYHVAFGGSSTPWPGGALYRSVDSEASYSQVASSTIEAISGTVPVALAFSDPHFLDTTSTLTVHLRKPELILNSIPDEALFNGGNRFVLGTGGVCEVGGFGEATLLAPGVYALSRLLRGRRGTEWTVGLHGANETFAMIDGGLLAVSMTLGDRNVERPYKAVTVGGVISLAQSFPFTPTAENLNPWTVANPEAVRNATTGDWAITWRMRSRFNGSDDYTLIGFDPDFSHFRLVVYTDATYVTVARTMDTDGGTPLDPESVKTVTYPASMQTTDFGSPQLTLAYRVYQVALQGLSHPEDWTA